MTATAYPPNESPGADGVVAVRRLVNDEIAQLAGRLLDSEGEFEFMCECGGLSCVDRVSMTLVEYRTTAPGSVVAHD